MSGSVVEAGCLLVFLPFEIHRRVTTAAFRRLARTVLGDKAFIEAQASSACHRPRNDQKRPGRATEPGQAPCQRRRARPFHRAVGHGLRRPAVIPDLVIDVQADKPAIEQVVVDVLHQLSFGTNRVERLDQARRNRRSGGIDGRRVWRTGFKICMQRGQNAIHQHPQLRNGCDTEIRCSSVR